MGSTLRTVLLIATALTWGTVHVVSLFHNSMVSPQFDTAFITLVGGILVVPRKKDDDTPKD